MAVYDGEAAIRLLTKMRLPKSAILELGSKVAGERANVSDNDPPSAVGYETWRWATRFAREDDALKELKWAACEKHNISGIRNSELKIKLVACTTDMNTGNPMKSPKNVTDKGPASCRLIGRNSSQFSMEFIDEEEVDDLWYFCGFYSDTYISLEISRPSGVSAGIITSFSDRIIISRPGEVPGIRRPIVQEDFADVSKPRAIRKN